MSAADWLEIEVVNWEKYNPRTDRANYSWFRLQNDIATEPKFHALTTAQRFIAVCLFAEVSKSGGKIARVRLSWLADQLKTAICEIHSTIRVLVSEGVFRCPSVSLLPATNDTYVTNVTNETDVTLAPAPKRDRAAREPSRIKPVWEKYKSAFEGRYGTAPPWNAKSAGMLKQLIGRIPEDEAPDVAAFYVLHSDAFYVRSGHPIGLLLKDAEKLRTEWATGRKVTSMQARQAEARDANVDAMKAYLAGRGGS